MTDSKGKQAGGETVDATPSNATSQSTSGTSAQSPGSPEAQIAIPQIIIQPADNNDARRPAQRAVRLPRSDRNFLEVPRPPQPRDRRAPSHPRRSPQARRPFGPGNLPLSLTGPVEAFHVPIDPLRMHPTGLTSSSTMPATTATGRPSGSRFDGNPYTPKGREVMAKVEDMLAADKALKGDPKAGSGSKLARLKTSFLEKLKSPARIFSRSKPRGPIKPHQIRHVRSLGPLSPAGELPPVPSPRLRQNERINVQKREKVLLVLGETPQSGNTFSASGPTTHTPPSSAEDPFSESSHEATRAPTAFEARLRATKSAGALLSRATTPDPFKTSRVMASNHDSLLPDDPTAASTPQRIPAFPPPPRDGVVGAQESPTKAPRTTTTATTTSSTPAQSQSRRSSRPDEARGARPQQRHARPCADAGSDESPAGRTAPAAAAQTFGGAVAVPRVARPSLHVGGDDQDGRRRGWVWDEEGEEDEDEAEEEKGGVRGGVVPWWEEDGGGEDEEGERERRRWEERGGMRGFGFGVGAGAGCLVGVLGAAGVGASEVGGVGEVGGGRQKRHPTPAPADLAALHQQLWERFPRLADAEVEVGAVEASTPSAVAAGWAAPAGGDEAGEEGDAEEEEEAMLPGAL